eukprot:3603305-Rhodomonas_salina.2
MVSVLCHDQCSVLTYSTDLRLCVPHDGICYALARQCPVLTWRMVLPADHFGMIYMLYATACVSLYKGTIPRHLILYRLGFRVITGCEICSMLNSKCGAIYSILKVHSFGHRRFQGLRERSEAGTPHRQR